MGAGATPEILNPDVYLNFLLPSTAAQYEISRNVDLVTLGALIWDTLSSIPEDWQIVRSSRPSAVLLAYFSARSSALAMAIMASLEKTGPITNCGAVVFTLCVFWMIASASSSYLFLKRVHVVFNGSKVVRHFFTIFWLAGVGTSSLTLLDTMHDYYEIWNTRHCVSYSAHEYLFAAFIVPIIFDALIYLAITYKLLSSSTSRRSKCRWTFWAGEALPRLSKAVLQGGQQYYLRVVLWCFCVVEKLLIVVLAPNRITTGVNVTRAILIFIPSLSVVFQMFLATPATAITSVMACRVFRNLRLEALRDTEVGLLTTMRFVDATAMSVQPPKPEEHVSPAADLESGVIVIDSRA